MRRWIAVAGGAAAVLTLMAGCSLPEGVDGALTDDWPAAQAPQVWSPKAGDCHRANVPEVVTLLEYRPIACGEQHAVETVHVGTFTGEHAARDTVPPLGSNAHRAAFGECVTKTTEYLGDDFRTGRVWLQVGLPSGNAWTGGARWFHCDVWEYANDDEWDVEVSRDGSLRDSLRGDRPLGFGCFAVTEKSDEIENMEPVACDKPHNAEFVGIAIAKDVRYPTDEKAQWEVMGKLCWGQVAAYAGLKNDSSLSYRADLIYQNLGQRQWDRGNRGVRCYLYLDKNVTKLMKGAGPSAFPTR
jgi:hypothetical protein